MNKNINKKQVTPNIMKKLFQALFIFSFVFIFSCEDEELMFNKDYLIDTKWGVPDIIELAPGANYDLSAPTIFYEDGLMSIGDSRYDFWRVRNSQSLHIEQMAEIWLILELGPFDDKYPDKLKLHVEKSKYPSGEFLMRCIYPSMD